MIDTNFFEGNDPRSLVQKYGTPLYVYNERVFRTRCREMKNLVTYPNFSVNFSVKANSNLTLLKIAHEEGLHADAMSPGEIFVEEKAGFQPDAIFYISNNVSPEEMQFAVDRGIVVSIDSLAQLRLFGEMFPSARVSLRINSGIGAGHSEKVVTGGKKTKFAITIDHLEIAKDFPGLEFIDCGGGFGMPYDEKTQYRLDLAELGRSLDEVFYSFARLYGRPIQFKIEPGRYLSAECGALLGTVWAVKENAGHLYCGTDIGFNVLIRPLLYDAYHEIETLPRRANVSKHLYNVVGNICESGDILAKDRLLPDMKENDLVLIHDAGAYSFSMSSNYNNRLRPAEVLIQEDGNIRLIRRRDTLEDLVRNFE